LLPTLEDLFPLLLSILSWVFLFVSSLPVLENSEYQEVEYVDGQTDTQTPA
jgi:hypothetical protein